MAEAEGDGVEGSDAEGSAILRGGDQHPSLPIPTSPRDCLAERQLALADGLRRLAAKAQDGAIAGASIVKTSVSTIRGVLRPSRVLRSALRCPGP